MPDESLKDGVFTILTFSKDATVKIYEKEVTPPGWDAGGKIDTTSNRNTALRSGYPKKLKTLTDSGATVSYHTSAIAAIGAMVGVNQLITATYPNKHTDKYWGWIDKWTPGPLKEGDQPTATLAIISSNLDDDGDETMPVHTPYVAP